MNSGYNCLHAAAVPWRINIFKMLLERGINSNCFSTELQFYGSLLDNMLFDESICKEWFEYTNNDHKKFKAMIKILKNYGGKEKHVLYTDTLKNYLIIFSSYPTGLATWDGEIEIKNIKGISPKLIDEFNSWKQKNPFIYTGSSIKLSNAEELKLLNKSNKKGIEIVMKIKKVVGPEIKIHYFYLDIDDQVSKFLDIKHSLV